MSLVDYASSSDDENDAVPEGDKNTPRPQPDNPKKVEDRPPKPHNPTTSSSPQPPTTQSVEKLPDAALLLGGGPSSSLLGKRDPVRAGPALLRSKVPRGAHLTHPKNVPDTGGGLLVPPQLRGRSNVVTEDIGKLFVRRNTESSSN